jgi:hypothetical protein
MILVSNPAQLDSISQDALEKEIAQLVEQLAPALLALPVR